MLTGLAGAGSVLYAGPVTWPGKRGRSGQHGMPLTCAGDPGQAKPGPDEPLTLPDTPFYAPSATTNACQHTTKPWSTGR